MPALSLLTVARIPVESSHIKSIGYDETSATLLIEFNTQQVWSYTPISRNTYEKLLNAESIGKMFHSEIRNNPKITAEKL